MTVYWLKEWKKLPKPPAEFVELAPNKDGMIHISKLAKTRVEKVTDVVKEGDKVLFGKWSGTEVKIEGETRLIMKESDILGIIE